MKNEYKGSISHMLQGLAHWMSYRREKSSIHLIESDVVFVATDILQSLLPKGYLVEREVTKKSLNLIAGKQRIDLGIKQNGEFKCLIEFKLADATNKGVVGDIKKLQIIKNKDQSIDCLVIILYRKSCDAHSPQVFLGKDGQATRKIIQFGNSNVKVRRVCNSFTSIKNNNSMKTICLELL